MEKDKIKAIIEAILFSAGREVSIQEFMTILEIGAEDITKIMQEIKQDFENISSGIELIKVDNSYQLCTKKEYYEYLYPIFDKQAKPNISAAAMETLSIIAYNPRITRSEIESIRGVNSDGTIYKLLEYELIEDAGKSDAPGKPTTYVTTSKFLKMFGISNLEELPELPRYKLDENEQIVIDEFINEEQNNNEETNMQDNQENMNAENIENDDLQ